MNKKILLTALALSLLNSTVAHTYGYSQTVINNTNGSADVHMNYLLCSDENFRLEPWKSKVVKAGWCSLKGVKSTVSIASEVPPGCEAVEEDFKDGGIEKADKACATAQNACPRCEKTDLFEHNFNGWRYQELPSLPDAQVEWKAGFWGYSGSGIWEIYSDKQNPTKISIKKR